MDLLEDSPILTWPEICNFSPKQEDFWKAILTHRYSLYGGTAGCGKTRSLVACAASLNFLYGAHHIPIHGGLASADMSAVQSRFIEHIDNLLVNNGFGEIVGTTKEGPPMFRFFDKRYGTIRFYSLYDHTKLKGKNIGYLAVDEITEVSEECFAWIDSRVRLAGTGNNPLRDPADRLRNRQPVFAATNPDGIHSHWVKEYFISKTFDTPLGKNRIGETDDYCFIPASLEDNPDEHFQKTYRHTLEQLSDEKRSAWLDGSWEYSSSVRFPFLAETYNHDLPDANFVVGLDYGYSKDETAIIFAACDGDGVVWVDNVLVFKGELIDDTAKIVVEELKTRYNKPSAIVYADPAIWSKTGQNLRQLPDYLRQEGLVVVKALHDHQVMNVGIEQLMQHGKIKFHVTRAAPLIKDLKAIRFGKQKNREILVPHIHTHTVYSLGFALGGMRRFLSEEEKLMRKRLREEAKLQAQIHGRALKRAGY